MRKLLQLIARTKPLMDTRNHVAHVTLGLAVDSNGEDTRFGSTFEMMRWHKKSKEFLTINLPALEKCVEAAKVLRDDKPAHELAGQTYAARNRPTPESSARTPINDHRRRGTERWNWQVHRYAGDRMAGLAVSFDVLEQRFFRG